MNYFARIKPVFNELTGLNVFDSLYVVRVCSKPIRKVTL
jgi:hypothetical protein